MSKVCRPCRYGKLREICSGSAVLRRPVDITSRNARNRAVLPIWAPHCNGRMAGKVLVTRRNPRYGALRAPLGSSSTTMRGLISQKCVASGIPKCLDSDHRVWRATKLQQGNASKLNSGQSALSALGWRIRHASGMAEISIGSPGALAKMISAGEAATSRGRE